MNLKQFEKAEEIINYLKAKYTDISFYFDSEQSLKVYFDVSK